MEVMSDLFRLDGKRALVTGGRNGNLGPVWVKTLEDAGAEVDIWDLPDVDLTNELDIYEAAQELPTPDIIVCNAAIDTPPSNPDGRFRYRYHATMQVNLNSHVYIVDLLKDRMRDHGGGVVVLIGSIMGRVSPNPSNYTGDFEKPVAYNLSKCAMQELARYITGVYGKHNIRAVCPGFGPVLTEKLGQQFIDTISPKIPMGRPVNLRSLQQTLLYACCCDDLAGEDWVVDGGYTKW